MSTPSVHNINRRLDETDWSGMPDLRLAVLRNVTVEPIEPFLRYEALKAGYRARVAFGAFDQIVQEAMRDDGLIQPELDAILIFCRLSLLSPRLDHDFLEMSDSERLEEEQHITSYIRHTLAALRQKTRAAILWHGFESPLFPAGGILDDQLACGHAGWVHGLNRRLADALRETGGSYFINQERLRSLLGAGHFYDHRLWHIARGPWTLSALQAMAVEDFKLLRALKGKSKKCLILDCDNTLWGGIAGEDGLPGIKIGSSYPGSAYADFQREALKLFHGGTLIALCSKNNEDDVWEVFDRHPDMVLKRRHIAIARINWTDKVENIRSIAEELNIGLDALVFVDDNPFEINMVRDLLPHVETLLLPSGQPLEYAAILAGCGWFDTVTLSGEDRSRTSMYQAEARRKAIRAAAGSTHDYLRSLDMEVTIAKADEYAIPRIAQLTQKTNQFNLTTRRYTEEHIRSLAASPESEVFSLRVSDRLGDSGIVGVCILRYEGNHARVDSFLLSCRILGRTLEDVFLRECLRCARQRGACFAVGQYIPTAKNSQTSEFFPRLGFVRDPAAAGEIHTFIFDLSHEIEQPSDCFHRIETPAGVANRT